VVLPAPIFPATAICFGFLLFAMILYPSAPNNVKEHFYLINTLRNANKSIEFREFPKSF